MSDPLPKQMLHVTLIQRNHEIQTLSADRADQAFAEGVRATRAIVRTSSREQDSAMPWNVAVVEPRPD
jgi:hypothetical protein